MNISAGCTYDYVQCFFQPYHEKYFESSMQAYLHIPLTGCLVMMMNALEISYQNKMYVCVFAKYVKSFPPKQVIDEAKRGSKLLQET